MSPFDQNGRHSVAGNFAGRFNKTILAIQRQTRHPGRLVQVGRNESGPGQKFFYNRPASGLVEKRCAVLADHDRIHYKRAFPARGHFRNQGNHGGTSESPGFNRARRNISENGFRLLPDKGGFQNMNTADRTGILNRDQSHDTHAVNTETLKCFQVCLKAGSPGRVRTGNRKSRGDHIQKPLSVID